MEYSVPIYWDEDYIRALTAASGQRRIKEVYGIPDGQERCPSFQALLRQGIRFNCLIDALCFDNLEFTRQGQKRITSLLDSYVKSGAAAVTVANPYLAMLIRKRHPGLSIVVSPAANINTLARAVFWDSLGVDAITLPGPAWNHDLSALGNAARSVKCAIRLTANNGCLRDCPVFLSHQLFDPWARVDAVKAGRVDYYRVMCLKRRLEKPELYIRSDWIRPEDTSLYEDKGVSVLRLAGAGVSVKRMMKIIAAYLAGSYDGNLLDILANCPVNGVLESLALAAGPRIENNKLNNFLRDMPGDCPDRSCDSCAYCRDAGEQAVVIPQRYRDEALKAAGEIINELILKGDPVNVSD